MPLMRQFVDKKRNLLGVKRKERNSQNRFWTAVAQVVV